MGKEGNGSDVTLVFEHAQCIPPSSIQETDDTGDTDDTDDTDVKDDTDDTDYKDYTDDTV